MERSKRCWGSGSRTTSYKDRGKYYATGSCGKCGRAGIRLTVDERVYQHYPNTLPSAMGVTRKMQREWPIDHLKFDPVWKPDREVTN